MFTQWLFSLSLSLLYLSIDETSFFNFKLGFLGLVHIEHLAKHKGNTCEGHMRTVRTLSKPYEMKIKEHMWKDQHMAIVRTTSGTFGKTT
jgi:hypothetical protein